MHIITPAVTLAKIANAIQSYSRQRKWIRMMLMLLTNITSKTLLPPGDSPDLTVNEKKTEANCEWASDRAHRRK